MARREENVDRARGCGKALLSALPSTKGAEQAGEGPGGEGAGLLPPPPAELWATRQRLWAQGLRVGGGEGLMQAPF